MKRSADDCCEAGFPIPLGDCPQCGAGPDDECKLGDDFTAREKRENVTAYLAGNEPPHTAR